MTETDSSQGNWKRHICAWLGHHNIGVRNLLYGTPEVMCLRCRAASWEVPTWSPFRRPATTHRPETTTDAREASK